MVTFQIANMEKSGLTKEQYENPEYLADYLCELWENSGKGRKAGVAVCVSLQGLYHAHIAAYGNTTTLKKTPPRWATSSEPGKSVIQKSQEKRSFQGNFWRILLKKVARCAIMRV